MLSPVHCLFTFWIQVMLLCTLTCVMLFVHNDAAKLYARQNIWPFIVALLAVLVTIISLSCCEGVRRTAPTNMIFLSIFTIGESIMVGYSTVQYDPEVVRRFFSFFSLCVFTVLKTRYKLNDSMASGNACSWCHRSRCNSTNDICLPNQMGFHNDGRLIVRCSLDDDRCEYDYDVHKIPGSTHHTGWIRCFAVLRILDM